MVCDKCQSKLGKVAAPEPWKAGSRGSSSSGGSRGESSGRKIGENKVLSSKKSRFNPYSTTFPKCKICKQSVHQLGGHYCQACAYKKAICALCGKKVCSTAGQRQSSA